MAIKKSILLTVLCAVSVLAQAHAVAATVKSEHIEAELIAEPSAIVPGKPFLAGLRLKTEPHWHVYWKNPGDAGLPVTIAWTLPEGFAAGAFQWPYPKRIELDPLVDYGYEGEVLLPVEVTVPANLSSRTVTLKAKAKWLVCHEICLPGSAELDLTLPVAASAAAHPAHAALFARTRAALPLEKSSWTISGRMFDTSLVLLAVPPASADASPGADAAHAAAAPDLAFFPDDPDIIENAAPQKSFTMEGGYALQLIRVPPDAESGQGPDSVSGVLVSSQGWGTADGRKALQIRVALERGLPMPKAITAPNQLTGAATTTSMAGTAGGAPEPQSGFVKLLIMLSLAFLGGLILNLMPCVLPVLSLKIFDFVKRAGESRWKIFSHGLIFTAGVLISFWVLAGLLLILRQGGAELGWGFQLQSPSFLIVLCALFFFFSLNLFGVFELGYMFTRLGGAGTQHGWAGSFMAGVTATVVATPCTAPFMGSAMGYAFTQPPYYAMLVFTFLGLGMASPYLILAGFPRLMKFLPKPGEWMEHLKQFMGFPLLATAIWLAWVLGKQAGVDALIALLFVLLLAGMSAWILGKWTALHRATPVRVVAGLVALVVFLPAFVMVLVYLDQIRDVHPGQGASTQGTRPVTAKGIAWEAFSEERVAELTAAGKPVFIDFTADWCLSCKVNERVALNTAEVARKFRELDVTPLVADWTSRDEKIARALAKYGRNSIPLYVLYSGNGPEDFVLLPEVLSKGIVLEALEKVATAPKTTMK